MALTGARVWEGVRRVLERKGRFAAMKLRTNAGGTDRGTGVAGGLEVLGRGCAGLMKRNENKLIQSLAAPNHDELGREHSYRFWSGESAPVEKIDGSGSGAVK